MLLDHNSSKINEMLNRHLDFHIAIETFIIDSFICLQLIINFHFIEPSNERNLNILPCLLLQWATCKITIFHSFNGNICSSPFSLSSSRYVFSMVCYHWYNKMDVLPQAHYWPKCCNPQKNPSIITF